MVFWWSGKGYLALLTLIGVYGVFGFILNYAVGEDAFERFPWLWGLGAFLSAAATWWVGCRVNGRTLKLAGLRHLRSRLYYPAHNRFVSLPVETWAFPMLALGVLQIVLGVLPQHGPV